jgi:hypothetical protein
MIRDLDKHKGDYSLLAAFSALFLGAVVKFQTNPFNILLATLIFALIYLIWGITHHIKAKSLTGKVVLEYFLVAVLAVVIVSTLLV